MSLNLDRSTWKRVKLGDVVLRSRIQVDAVDGGVDRYVAGGDVDTESVIIQRSGDVADGQMGSTFRYLFKPGQVLFVSARPYLRKLGVPDFAGVVADKTYVLDAAPGNGLLHDMLPFLLTSDHFVEYATQEATGSMNPRLLWGAMQRYEFHLPPLDEQRRIADLLWAVERHRLTVTDEIDAIGASRMAAFRSWLNGITSWTRLGAQFEVQLGKMLSKTSQPTDDDRGYPYLANVNVRWNDFDLSDLRYVRLDAREREKFLLRSGDILVCEGGQIGRAAIWDSRLGECYYQKALHRLRPIGVASLPGPLLVAFLELLAVEGRLAAHSTGTTFAHLTRERLIEVEIPAVSTAEVVAVQETLGGLDRAGDALSIELSALSDLRSCLLADIFGGR